MKITRTENNPVYSIFYLLYFVLSFYRDLYGWEDARPTAIDNFKKQRGEMHHILETMLSSDLKLGLNTAFGAEKDWALEVCNQWI